MKFSIAILTAFGSYSLACMSGSECHDGPARLQNPMPLSPGFSIPGISTPGKAGGKQRNGGGTRLKKPKRDIDAYLHARGYYDDLDDFSVYARDAEIEDSLLYDRDVYEDDIYARDYMYVNPTMSPERSGQSNGGGFGIPQLPIGANPQGFHLFIRLNTIPKAYPPFGIINHAGLNKLMADLGGQHVDVVYGSPLNGYSECGLALIDAKWTTTHSDADGYPVKAVCRPLIPGERDAYSYVGEYGGGSVKALCKCPFSLDAKYFRALLMLFLAQALLAGKTYDHKVFHCGTFVQQLIKIMGF
jgi:hypothetical protein